MLQFTVIIITVTVELGNDSVQETPTPNNNCVSNNIQNGHKIELKHKTQIPGHLSIYTIFQVIFKPINESCSK